MRGNLNLIHTNNRKNVLTKGAMRGILSDIKVSKLEYGRAPGELKLF